LVVGETDDGVAGEDQLLIAIPVALEGRRHRVVRVAIGFDDEPGCWPEEVHHESLDLRICDGLREIVVVGELKEQDLQLTPEVCGTDAFEGIEQSPERGRAVLPRMLIETPTDGEKIEEVETIRLCNCILHRPGSQMW
jgi:hypothetical protein